MVKVRIKSMRQEEDSRARLKLSIHLLIPTFPPSAGLTAFVGLILPAVAGAVFLHPDFGIDKGNKLYRKVHKVVARLLLFLAWAATISGFKTLIGDDYVTLAMFAAPVVIAAPFTLL